MQDLTNLFFLDFEHRAEKDIKDIGGYKHAQIGEPILATFAKGDAPVSVWEPRIDDPALPDDIQQAAEDPSVIFVAHNCAYDRTILKHALGIDVPIERWIDTMAIAYTLGLPGNLAQLGEVLGLPTDQQKIKDGKALIHKFCKPRKPSKTNPDKYWTKRTKPAEWDRFVEYGVNDVVAMRECLKRMPLWNFEGRERELWHLDQRMNERGIHLDKTAVRAAMGTVEKAVEKLNAETVRITRGELDTTTQVGALKEYLEKRIGCPVESIAKAAVAAMLEHEQLDDVSRRLLEIRTQVGKASTAKLAKMIQAAVDTDDGAVLQGMFQYYGAFRTGRWAGRLVQLQNLPQGNLKGDAVLDAVDAMLYGIVDLLYPDPMSVVSSCLRPMLVAAPGKSFYVSDLKNIEGRAIAWVSDEQWKLQAFRDYDAGIGPDLYKIAYARSFGVDANEVGYHERQIGKVQELALGFEGGVGAYVDMANTYRIDLDELPPVVLPKAKTRHIRLAEKALARDRSRGKFEDMADETYIAIDIIKLVWRQAHLNVVASWKACKTAAVMAVNNPGKVYRAKRFRFKKTRDWLVLILPSGRGLCYYKPSIKRGVLHFWGLKQLDNGARVWTQQAIYGGKIYQNGIQGTARDVLAHNMPAVEEAGFMIAGSVHDENITESWPGRSIEELNRLLSLEPPWAEGLPLAADGFVSQRYMKAA